MQKTSSSVLDDFADPQHTAAEWTVFTDRVMGGVSAGQAELAIVSGRRALRLTGSVSLERNGGFIQVARPLSNSNQPVDAMASTGLQLDVCGVPGAYFVHVRSAQCRAPWQHYRAPLPVTSRWQTITIPWSSFVPVGLDTPLDITRLTRLGVVAGTRAFEADVALARLVVA